MLLESTKCGESNVTVLPTLIWAVGITLLAQLAVQLLFKRFIFRQIPWWEVILQETVFIWMVVYGVRTWLLLIKLIKILWIRIDTDVDHTTDVYEQMGLMCKCLVWSLSTLPCTAYGIIWIRHETNQPIIWFTRNHWMRRELGPHGYFLRRPVAFNTDEPCAAQLRLVRSDTNVLIEKYNGKRIRTSKSL